MGAVRGGSRCGGWVRRYCELDRQYQQERKGVGQCCSGKQRDVHC